MNWRAAAIALIAFLGMVDTFYLSAQRDRGVIPCHVTEGCGDVLTSAYSEIAGIPLSWFGLAFYLAVFSCAVFELFGTAALTRIYWLAAAAFLVSIVLTGIQAFVLKAFCEYCLASAVFVTTIFLLSPRRDRHKHPE